MSSTSATSTSALSPSETKREEPIRRDLAQCGTTVVRAPECERIRSRYGLAAPSIVSCWVCPLAPSRWGHAASRVQGRCSRVRQGLQRGRHPSSLKEVPLPHCRRHDSLFPECVDEPVSRTPASGSGSQAPSFVCAKCPGSPFSKDVRRGISPLKWKCPSSNVRASSLIAIKQDRMRFAVKWKMAEPAGSRRNLPGP